MKGLACKILRLSASPVCTSSDNIVWAGQKEHCGRGKHACERSRVGSMKKLVEVLGHEGLE
eukprot:scaffold142321_cov14-Tisochrysis_lutea.AAC.1